MHSIGDTSGIEGELHMMFRGDANRNSLYSLVIPLEIGSSASAPFFASLGTVQRTQLSIGAILPADMPMLLFRGASIYTRTANAPTCEDGTVDKINYVYGLKRLTLAQKDVDRFKRLLNAHTPYTNGGGPVVGTTAIPASKLSLISYIPKLLVTSSKVTGTGTKAVQNGYVETAQVKCRPLDPARDIKGSKVFVGGPGESRTLKDELEDAANPNAGLAEAEASPNVEKIESVLAILIGVLLGVVTISFIVWFVFRRTELKYNKNNLLYAAAKLKEAAAATGVNEATKKALETGETLLRTSAAAAKAALKK